MKDVQRVVSVGAHSLDAELLGGLMLQRYADKGAKCTFLHITRGERGHKTLTEEEYAVQLLKENVLVADAMGCDSKWIGYTSLNLPTEEQFILDLIEYFEAEKVDLVITHYKGSFHPRHVATYAAVTEAVRRMRNAGKDITLFYGETCEDLIGFYPQVYVVFSEEEVARWWKALENYEIFGGTVNDIPYQEYYRSNLIVRKYEGMTNGLTRAFMFGSEIRELLK